MAPHSHKTYTDTRMCAHIMLCALIDAVVVACIVSLMVVPFWALYLLQGRV